LFLHAATTTEERLAVTTEKQVAVTTTFSEYIDVDDDLTTSYVTTSKMFL